jgi:TolB-like protein/Flp pilus assembly protein TadD
MQFIAELKRRNVIRVALGYAVLSWLLLQIGDVLFEALRLDDSALTIMLVIMSLGFIPVVIFAWVYELTPDGVKRESEVDRNQSIAGQTGHRLNVAIVILLSAALALFAWDRLIAPDGARAPADGAQAELASSMGERSIAVLPFADMSAQGDQAYFGDGIAEELLNVLAKVDGLKVAARTSSFKFRGDEHDIVEIGRALNVTTVLEGSVRKAGDQVRITAQLIDIAGGYHLWSESYDRQLDNILAVQDEIAAAIVNALKLELQLQPESGAAGHVDSGEAYDLYLRGREYGREPSKAGLLRAIQFYEEALVLDPDFALAHGAIASAWIWLEDYGGIPADDAFDRAEPAAKRALDLDSGRADALTAMGFLEDRKYQNTAAAHEYFERALAANPSFTLAATLYGDSLNDLGRFERALEVRRDAANRDPLSSFLKARVVFQLGAMGRTDEAERLLDEIFAVNPEDTYGHEELGNLRYNQGRLAEAIRAYEFVHENRPGDPYSAANIAACYALMMDFDSAAAWIDAARARGAGNRWELQGRRFVAWWQGDWDALFRVGQLYLARDGTLWQAQASLGKADWEVARVSFQRSLSRMNYRVGDALNSNLIDSLVGLAYAEKRLGLESWAERAAAAKSYTEKALEQTVNFGSWPSYNGNYMLARIAAIEGDVDGAVKYMRAAWTDRHLYQQFFTNDPFFAELRDEPRLLEIAEQTRLHALAERQKILEASSNEK